MRSAVAAALLCLLAWHAGYARGGQDTYNAAAFARASQAEAMAMHRVAREMGPVAHFPAVPFTSDDDGARTNDGCGLPAWLPETVTRWRKPICQAAGRHGVDPMLLAIVVTVESGGNPRARSHANALGLGQVVPRWWPAITRDGDWSDPEHNLDVSAYVLADALRRYGVRDDGPDWALSVDRAAATYNGGSPWQTASETNRYRAWVSGMWAERHKDASPTLERWLAAGGQRLVAAAETAAVVP